MNLRKGVVMDKGFVHVYTTDGLTKAEMLRDFLLGQGIQAVASQEGAGVAYGLTIGDLGAGHVYVPAFQEAAALEFLEAIDNGEFTLQEELPAVTEAPGELLPAKSFNADQQIIWIYARDAADILRNAIQMVQRGERAFYRVAAVQLRILLCDTTRRHDAVVNIALLPYLYPDLKLPQVNEDGEFDDALEPLPVETWLDQPLFLEDCGEVTLRQLIRRICDQDGGAHVDLHPGATLGPDAIDYIVYIGELILDRLF